MILVIRNIYYVGDCVKCYFIYVWFITFMHITFMTTKSMVECAWVEDMGQFLYHLDSDWRVARRLEKLQSKIINSVPSSLIKLAWRTTNCVNIHSSIYIYIYIYIYIRTGIYIYIYIYINIHYQSKLFGHLQKWNNFNLSVTIYLLKNCL